MTGRTNPQLVTPLTPVRAPAGARQWGGGA
jgi:hypothetical protein